jgi:predicted nucleic acid-binding protein
MKVLTDAVALKAEVVITGDRAIRALEEYVGIKILTPQEFLKKFRML